MLPAVSAKQFQKRQWQWSHGPNPTLLPAHYTQSYTIYRWSIGDVLSDFSGGFSVVLKPF